MLPWGHMAAGYLLYTTMCHAIWRHRPDGYAMFALALGTQFPDLVDKPLAYWAEIIQGRAIGHSALVAIPIAIVVIAVATRYDHQTLGIAFVVGHVSHLLGDAIPDLFYVDSYGISYLLWPLLPAPEYDTRSFLQHVEDIRGSLAAVSEQSVRELLLESLVLELSLGVAVFFVWAFDGFPGADVVYRFVRTRLD